jgi:hypothetical protein
MTIRNHYFAGGLLSLALLAAGCAAKDTDVRTGPIRGESNVQQDNSGSSSSRSVAALAVVRMAVARALAVAAVTRNEGLAARRAALADPLQAQATNRST